MIHRGLITFHAISRRFDNQGPLPGVNEYRASVDLVNGTFHDIVIEYREEEWDASIQV